jgi:hypothetical protein
MGIADSETEAMVRRAMEINDPSRARSRGRRV